MPGQVLSANPFGLLFELFNTEYERRASNTLTVGVGGSTAMVDTYDYDGWGQEVRRERYVNGDVFLRYYPARPGLRGPLVRRQGGPDTDSRTREASSAWASTPTGAGC